MTTQQKVLPTSELKSGVGAVFTNGDAPATDKDLTRPLVARLAMAGAFSDWIEQEKQKPGSVREMLLQN